MEKNLEDFKIKKTFTVNVPRNFCSNAGYNYHEHCFTRNSEQFEHLFDCYVLGVECLYDSFTATCIPLGKLANIYGKQLFYVSGLLLFAIGSERLAYDDPEKANFETAMSNLNEIAMLGRELGFYILIGMQRPDGGSLPIAIRGQLNLKINMGVPTPEIEKMVFQDNEKQLRPLSSNLKGWGFIKIGDSQVRSFFAPEIPKNFNLHDYIRNQITYRSQGNI